MKNIKRRRKSKFMVLCEKLVILVMATVGGIAFIGTPTIIFLIAFAF